MARSAACPLLIQSRTNLCADTVALRHEQFAPVKLPSGPFLTRMGIVQALETQAPLASSSFPKVAAALREVKAKAALTTFSGARWQSGNAAIKPHASRFPIVRRRF
jgi:hypothetical protein